MKKAPAKRKSPTPLDRQFWQRFSAHIWQKRAMTFPNIISPLTQMDADQIFEMLVQYAELCRKSDQAEGFKLFLDGIRQHEQETLQFLPERNDKSLQGYHKRMESLFPDYCLVCDELLQVSLESWGKLTQFTHSLYQQVGFPNRFAEIGMYLGNYQKTPFGVHVDGCGVFSFPAVGTKTFRIWTEAYVQKNPDLIEAHQYDKFKKGSQILTAGPGDMTYWPSQAWHIAESDGSFSATWSLGVWVDRPHKDVLTLAMKEFFEASLGENSDLATTRFSELHSATGQIKELPDLYRQTAKALARLNQRAIQDLLLKNWMSLVSNQGLKTLPRAGKGKKLSLNSNIQLRIPAPILWSKLGESRKCAFAYAGQVQTLQVSAAFLDLMQDLNQGKNCQLSNYLNASAPKAQLKFLQALQSLGAFKSGRK